MARPRVYPDELRERAVRLVMEWREARGVTDGGYTAVCTQLGLHRETLRRWVIEVETEAGSRPGLSRSDRDRVAELERENRELRRANEILKTAAAFFGAELDRRQKKSRLHRPLSGALRGRADLQGAAGRPIDLLRR